ncbi:MAG: transcription-repair coupling factor [Planctomycetes bacterium]|nr:transcription-repair coupling factor [Planctomycetota bacterium]
MPTSPEALAPIVSALASLPPVARLLAGARRADVAGLWGSAPAVVVGAACEGRGRIVALAPSPETAESLVLDLSTFFPELAVSLLPVSEEDAVVGPELKANRSERLFALATLDETTDGVLVIPAAVLLEALPAPDGERVVVARGGKLDRERLLAQLAEAGFERVPLVAAPGEVSLRGDILDVYPWAAEHPVRIELFDDEVEDLRRFSVDSQRSVETLDVVTLSLGSGDARSTTLLDVLGLDTTVLLVDPPKIKDRLAEASFERGVEPRRVTWMLERLHDRPGGDLFALDVGLPETDVSLQSVGGDPRSEEEVLRAWQESGRRVALLSDTEADNERLAQRLAEGGFPLDGTLVFCAGRVTAGFAFPAGGPVLVQHHELLGRRAVRRRRPKRVVATRALDSLAELNPGDYVVHLLHGVARYHGMERLAREQGEEDFLVLEFAEDSKLYVPASRIDLVERFIGGDVRGPKLDKLGGKTWRRKKEKVSQAVQDLAAELLEIQARRAGEGHAFPPEDKIEVRFALSFPYEDTPDQHTSWHQVRGDMEKSRPMDRLVVGDVGFGKTEVAVRAAFKAVMGGKQVAVLVPTTILAEQHHETFARRMSEEPVRVESLSRLSGDAATTDILADLRAGKVDVVIGTHRLLGSKVKFKDLGLVVVDEEQRFGVVHKERLKQLKSSVDVLTLSATPIPRTLHMALSGLRDISTIRTPPPGRRPVVTRVTYESDELLQNALRHELHRDGQVFLLHNRVETIGRVLDRVHTLVPHARAAYAHGQMPTREMQGVVDAFARGELDVLVCTTIVESGIDIPRANTIIVLDAQRFGLADLHQLRGRVGREDTQAYAFFLVPPGKLGEQAERRLKAIEEFSSLDAGLPIALRDLELRGAGNLLGAEQSGHIMAVGYDMYCRLLQKAVAAAQGKPVADEPGEVEVDLGLVAFLPADYVPDEALRMALLRRLAHAGRRKLAALVDEMVDRFGELPEPAKELVDLFELRRLVRLAGVASLAADGLGGMTIAIADEQAFTDRHPFRPEEIYLITPRQIRVPWPRGIETPRQRLRYLLERFQSRARAATAR